MGIEYVKPSGFSDATALSLRTRLNVHGITLNAAANSDITTSLQALIDAYNFVTIDKAGTYLISNSIEMPSNSHLKLGKGVILKMVNATNNELITNSDYVGGNSGITIEGGTFDCNGANQTQTGIDASGFRGTGLLFKNVTNLKLKDLTVKDPYWFGIQLGKTTYFTLENIDFDYPNSGGDCVHINGQCNNGYVSNIKTLTITRDDTFALVAKDVPEFNIYEGSIYNIICKGIETYDALKAVRIISAGYEVRDISITSIQGNCRESCITIDEFAPYITPAGDSIISNINISDVNAIMTTAGQPGLIVLDSKIDSINISNVNRNISGLISIPTIVFYTNCDLRTINLSNFIIKDNSAGTSNSGIISETGAIVDTILINNYVHEYIGTNTAGNRGRLFYTKNLGATFKDIILNNISVKNVSTVLTFHKSSVRSILISNAIMDICTGIITFNTEAATSDIDNIALLNVDFYSDGTTPSGLLNFLYTF